MLTKEHLEEIWERNHTLMPTHEQESLFMEIGALLDHIKELEDKWPTILVGDDPNLIEMAYEMVKDPNELAGIGWCDVCGSIHPVFKDETK